LPRPTKRRQKCGAVWQLNFVKAVAYPSGG
jgi:hypothetical protein